MAKPLCVTILSGGMDSTTLAYCLQSTHKQIFVSFDYGQRHVKELQCASITASKLGCEHIVIPLPIGKYLKGSSLTDEVAVPHGHYEEDTMRQTVVPGRNAIMLSIAWGIATAYKADAVAYGAHVGDAAQYPDCRPEFVDSLTNALKLGVWDGPKELMVPFLRSRKMQILGVGLGIKVPYEDTWTCYEGGVQSCGRCGSCCERLEAFYANSAADPLEYKDRTSWMEYLEAFRRKEEEGKI
jgi:7-cyano-7-deazaguanine synthase